MRNLRRNGQWSSGMMSWKPSKEHVLKKGSNQLYQIPLTSLGWWKLIITCSKNCLSCFLPKWLWMNYLPHSVVVVNCLKSICLTPCLLYSSRKMSLVTLTWVVFRGSMSTKAWWEWWVQVRIGRKNGRQIEKWDVYPWECEVKRKVFFSLSVVGRKYTLFICWWEPSCIEDKLMM